MGRKRFFIQVLALVMLLGIAHVAGANFVQTLDEVSFYVVDDNTPSGDDSVTLEIFSIAQSGTLQYSTDKSTWTDIYGNSIAIATGSDDWERVWFRLDLGSGSYVTKGTLTFSGADGNLWNAVSIEWDGNNGVTFNTAGDNDNVAPVPIPGAVWLLGSGLIGLVAFGGRRRKKNMS